jgi:putative membrane protein
MIKTISFENRWIGLLLLFYFFGLIGISFAQYRDFFLPLTPFNLVLTLVVFYKINQDYSNKFLILSFLIFLIGFSVEVIGVTTGVLFGSYAYGNYFGIKIFETPIMIGVNWLFLALSTHGVTQYFTKKALWLILIPSLLMTSLDFLQNYLMWFITSIFIHGLIYFFRPKINAKVSFVIIVSQLIFFGVLNLVL